MRTILLASAIWSLAGCSSLRPVEITPTQIVEKIVPVPCVRLADIPTERPEARKQLPVTADPAERLQAMELERVKVREDNGTMRAMLAQCSVLPDVTKGK